MVQLHVRLERELRGLIVLSTRGNVGRDASPQRACYAHSNVGRRRAILIMTPLVALACLVSLWPKVAGLEGTVWVPLRDGRVQLAEVARRPGGVLIDGVAPGSGQGRLVGGSGGRYGWRVHRQGSWWTRVALPFRATDTPCDTTYCLVPSSETVDLNGVLWIRMECVLDE